VEELLGDTDTVLTL